MCTRLGITNSSPVRGHRRTIQSVDSTESGRVPAHGRDTLDGRWLMRWTLPLDSPALSLKYRHQERKPASDFVSRNTPCLDHLAGSHQARSFRSMFHVKHIHQATNAELLMMKTR